ncbi:MAG TPA: FAD-binding oxidoreductase [Candidatus Limnocylindrales bacterium]|nr:FAD-binding oxidoreductase [Candidatus Limnocylindrales bacterium]
MKRYESWGRYPRATHRDAICAATRLPPQLDRLPAPVLAYGKGRSYGDCCLNDGGFLLDTSQLNKIESFDAESGILRCEAGVTLAEILRMAVPRGWFPAVVPGTKFVTVGGAIANDIHGKNHHREGTFGRSLRQFELRRSNGETLRCSPTENLEYLRATIGGLGLTGLILRAEIQLKKIPSSWIEAERIRFDSLEDFFSLSAESDRKFEFTVAWLDFFAPAAKTGRGVFFRGNFAEAAASRKTVPPRGSAVGILADCPEWLINRGAVRLFNLAYGRGSAGSVKKSLVSYDSFFFPLDGIHNWNRLYGKRGFFQYQCVVPPKDARGAMEEILRRVRASREIPSLSVLKTFGDVESPGLLSFPRPGVTLALDLANRGASTLQLMDELDEIVRGCGGAVYPAKDARMSAASYKAYFPRWREFQRIVDPCFSSSFWRRVTPAGCERNSQKAPG